MIKKLIFTLILFCEFILNAQDVKQSLIVAHVDVASKSEFKQKLISYHFLNGHFTGKDEVMTIVGKKDGKDYLRTDLGINQIYKNRYLITGIGNIIDLKDKKIMFDGRANLVRMGIDSAIYYTNDAFKGKFYSVYNFKTNTYSEVKNLTFKAKPGQDVEYDKTNPPYKLFLYPPSKPKVQLVADAGYGQTIDGSKPDPLLWWLDNNNFVYANFNKENTEITFNKINVESKNQTTVGKVSIAPEKQQAKFIKLNEFEGLFFIGQKQILIDIKNNKVTDLQFSKEDNGFCYETKATSSGRVVKYNNADCGKYHFQPKNFVTNKNIAALVKEIIIGTDSYQQGMGVWNFDTKKWENVNCEDVLTLIGIINE
jgi:hypothetical protein